MLALATLPVEANHEPDLALTVLEDRQLGDLVVKAVRVRGGMSPQAKLISTSCQVLVPGAGILERHVVQTESGELLGVRYAWPHS